MISRSPAEVVLPLPLPFLRSSAQILLSHGQPSTGNGLLYGPRGSRGSLWSGPVASSSSVGLPPPLPRFGMTIAMNSQRWNGESRAVRDSSVIAPWPNVCVCECTSTSHRYHVESKTWLLSTHAKSFKWHVRTSWNLQNWQSAKFHSKTQKKREENSLRDTSLSVNSTHSKESEAATLYALTTWIRAWTCRKLSARFPSGRPRRCQNGLCQRFAVIACAMPIDGVEFRMISACTGSKLSRE